MTNDAIITVSGLTLCRGLNMIISDLDLKVMAGQSVVIRGANGSGKTSLLRAMAGLLPREDGHISINGMTLDDDRLGVMQSLIYIGHRDGFSGHLTAGENLSIWAASRGMTRGTRNGQTVQVDDLITDALNELGMDGFANTPLYMMSEGQRKRCGLARLALALLCDESPPIWLLDEPLTALDHNTAGCVAQLINKLNDKGGAAVVSTHHDIDLKSAMIITLDDERGLL